MEDHQGDGLKDREQADDAGRRSAGGARDRGRRQGYRGRKENRGRDRVPGDCQGECRWRRYRYADRQRRKALEEAINAGMRIAESAFGDATVFLEKYLVKPRHIEFQLLADEHGNIVHLYDRECSIQRRHQKLVEEAPCPIMTPELRERMAASAIAVAKASDYTNAGTVEFLYSDGNYYFMEMNTRLQVEHTVTELITGLDIVKKQISIAAGDSLPIGQEDTASVVMRSSAVSTQKTALQFRR